MIPAKTVGVSRLLLATAMTWPMPSSAPNHSATTAPMMQSSTATRSPANRYGSAEGNRSRHSVSAGPAWTERKNASASGSTARSPVTALTSIGKNAMSAAMNTFGVVPNPNQDLAFIVHHILITRNGILNHENLDFNELIKDRAYEFVYVFAPVPIKGATGSAGTPIAIT